MTGALIILAALIIVGLILYINEYLEHKRDIAADPTAVDPKSQKTAGADSTTPENSQESQDEECCGMHVTCERDSLLTAVADKIE